MDEAGLPFHSLVENVSSVLVRVVSSAYITNLNFSLDKAKSFTYNCFMMNNIGPRIEPLGTPVDISSMFDFVSFFLCTAFYLLNNFLIIIMVYHVCRNTVI